MELRDTTLISAREQVAASSLADGAALLDLQTSTYYSLNSVGAYIWSIIAAPTTFSSILEQIVDRFAVDAEHAESDLRGLLTALAEAQLVHISNAQAD